MWDLDGKDLSHLADYEPIVGSFHRIVVHGSTVPLEYLRLTASPKNQPATTTSFGPFSWERVTQ